MPGQNGFSGLLQGDWGWSFEYRQAGDGGGRRRALADAAGQPRGRDLHPPGRRSPSRSIRPRGNIRSATMWRRFIGYIGLATPSFLLALILLYYANRWFGVSIGGLYDPQYAGRALELGRRSSRCCRTSSCPTLVIGLGGTAAMIRRMRANLLDELGKQYYVTAEGQGPAAAQGAAEISVPHVAQPVHRRYRQPAAASRLGLGAGVAGAEPADRRPDPARAR